MDATVAERIGRGISWAVGRIQAIYRSRDFDWDWRQFAADILLVSPGELPADAAEFAKRATGPDVARLCEALRERLAQVEDRDRFLERQVAGVGVAQGKDAAAGEM